MNLKRTLNDIKTDLEKIRESANERLLKEEQVRSAIYCSLKQQGYIVAAERNYNKKSEKECDLVFWKNKKGKKESWMEIKTSWYSSSKDKRRKKLNNKPKAQLEQWKKDIKKLNKKRNVSKYFVLVEQHSNQHSLYDKVCNGEKYPNSNFFKKCELKKKITFDLKWKKAPVDECTIRIFEVKSKKRTNH